MSSFSLKQGDTSPALEYSLVPDDVSLTGATVRFRMENARRETVIDRPGTIASEQPPILSYEWQAGDTAENGLFSAEFAVTYSGGAVETFPNEGFIAVAVNRRVPDAPDD